MLNIENEEDLDAIIRILSCILRDKLIRVMRKKVSKEEGKKDERESSRHTHADQQPSI